MKTELEKTSGKHYGVPSDVKDIGIIGVLNELENEYGETEIPEEILEERLGSTPYQLFKILTTD